MNTPVCVSSKAPVYSCPDIFSSTLRLRGAKYVL
jgi:hypothetical protein